MAYKERRKRTGQGALGKCHVCRMKSYLRLYRSEKKWMEICENCYEKMKGGWYVSAEEKNEF